MDKDNLSYLSGIMGGVRYPYWVPIMSVFVGLYGKDWLYIEDWEDWTVVISIN